MYKKLSIIIPYYKESESDIFPLLSSIHNQVGVDFGAIECILINDGNGNVFSETFLQLFDKLNIRIGLMEENRGPGAARQDGIDNAVGEYLLFCDADDILHSAAVLGMFLQEIEQNRPDIITTPWLEEILNPVNGEYRYINHDDESTWMHGKVFRRDFLHAKNIRFDDELRVHEDSYFLALAFAQTGNARKIPVTSYIWKWHENSITRRDSGAYTYNSMCTFIAAIEKVFIRLEKIAPNEMTYKVIQFLIYNYFTLHQSNWLSEENRSYLLNAEKTFTGMITPYLKYFNEASYDYICTVYNQERAKNFNNAIENETLKMWLERIFKQHSEASPSFDIQKDNAEQADADNAPIPTAAVE